MNDGHKSQLRRNSNNTCGQAMGRTAGVLFPAKQDFSLIHSTETNSEAHSASYPVETGSCLAAKAVGREADH